MKQNLFRHIGIALYAVLVASCADDVPIDESGIEPGEASDKICFMVSDKASSRGSRPDDLRRGGAYIKNVDGSDSLYLELTVSDIPAAETSRAAHITTNDYDLRMSCLRRRTGNVYDYYFANTLFTKGKNGVWVSDPEYWWLDANTNFKFYGYAPADVNGATFIADKQTWEPKVDYSLPGDVTKQVDLLYSNPPATDVWMVAAPQQSVRLFMKHAMACIGFKTGKGMTPGTINSITIRNAVGRGVLNLADGQWTLDTETLTDFYADLGIESADDTELTDNDAKTFFMMLPGGNIEATTVDIDFTAADGTNTVYTGHLLGDWKAGKQYMYNFTINPDLDITVVPETQDAHYVICRAHVSDRQNGRRWALSVTSDDGADVTITDELNEFQRRGFWIDEIREPGKDPIPARGSSTLTGTGDRDVYIFLPENITSSNRTITLTLRIEEIDEIISEKTFQQVCPAWSGTFGWEQTEDNTAAQFGFNWTRVAHYAYVYPASLSGNEAYNKFCQSVIEDNNVQHCAGVWVFSASPYTLKYAISIEYARLTGLSNTSAGTNDGLYNTKQLYKLGGTVALGAFEPVLSNIYVSESGDVHTRSFRLGDGTEGEAPAPVGDDEVEMPAVGACLLKNRWYLAKIVSEEGDVGYVPHIDEEDLVWYLPAVNQFRTLPTTAIDPIVPGECWSSTSVSDAKGQAYLGDRSTDNRMTRHKVRACRK